MHCYFSSILLHGILQHISKTLHGCAEILILIVEQDVQQKWPSIQWLNAFIIWQAFVLTNRAI